MNTRKRANDEDSAFFAEHHCTQEQFERSERAMWNSLAAVCSAQAQTQGAPESSTRRPRDVADASAPDEPPEPAGGAPCGRRAPYVAKHPDGLIAKSWDDPATRRARLDRNHVEVWINGDNPREFGSIAKMFAEFGIPKTDLPEIRANVKMMYQRFIAGECESEFVALEHKGKIFAIRVAKKDRT